jgi:hypothetical protein
MGSLHTWKDKTFEEFPKLPNLVNESRVKQLLDLGFVTTVTEEQQQTPELLQQTFQDRWNQTWKEMVEKLEQFKDNYGTYYVSLLNDVSGNEEFRMLRLWANEIREQVQAYETDPESCPFPDNEKSDFLLDLNFHKRSNTSDLKTEGDKWEISWQHMRTVLQKCKEKYGTYDVPESSEIVDKTFVPLSNWIRRTRQEILKFKNKSVTFMTQERIHALQDSGVELQTGNKVEKQLSLEKQWDLRWEEMLEKLDDYKNRFGTCDVPSRVDCIVEEEFLDLSGWVVHIRGLLKAFEEYPRLPNLLNLHSEPHRVSTSSSNGWIRQLAAILFQLSCEAHFASCVRSHILRVVVVSHDVGC